MKEGNTFDTDTALGATVCDYPPMHFYFPLLIYTSIHFYRVQRESQNSLQEVSRICFSPALPGTRARLTTPPRLSRLQPHCIGHASGSSVLPSLSSPSLVSLPVGPGCLPLCTGGVPADRPSRVMLSMLCCPVSVYHPSLARSA